MADISSTSVQKPLILTASRPKSKETSSKNPIPTYLITGLLGSGKTTTLLELLKQKPKNEIWGILINEFGEISLDDKLLQSAEIQNVIITTVQGGCICCTAGHQLSQAIQNFINQQKQLDKLWIEPTGLGHPAGIIDTLNQTPQVQLRTTLATLTPKQLTPERWQKSAVMRDIATLSDIILLTQTDLASKEEVQQALKIVEQLYPKKTKVWYSYDALKLQTLIELPPIAFKIRESSHLDQPLQTLQLHSNHHQLQNISVQLSARSKQILALGLSFDSSTQFNRVQLKNFFNQQSEQLIRAKGLVRTGKNWQLLQWQGSQLSLSDFAWRQDSRIELLLNPEASSPFYLTSETEPSTLENKTHPNHSENELPAGILVLLKAFTDCIHEQ